MLEIIGIVIFVLLIGLSIALHEMGHLVPAKRFGVKVTEYMIGFGPTLWSRRSGETRYGLKAFPVGGYIRMIGMLPPAPGDPVGTARSMTTGRFATMIAQARQQSLDEVGPDDENRVFYNLPVHRRIIIMLGGPFMNLAFALVLFGVLLMGVGLPAPSLEVASVGACTPTAAQPTGEPCPRVSVLWAQPRHRPRRRDSSPETSSRPSMAQPSRTGGPRLTGSVRTRARPRR